MKPIMEIFNNVTPLFTITTAGKTEYYSQKIDSIFELKRKRAVTQYISNFKARYFRNGKYMKIHAHYGTY